MTCRPANLAPTIGELDKQGLQYVINVTNAAVQRERTHLTNQCQKMYETWKQYEMNQQLLWNSHENQFNEAYSILLQTGKALIQPFQLLYRKQDEIESQLRLLSDKLKAEQAKNPMSSAMITLQKQFDSLEKQRVILKHQIQTLKARSNRRWHELKFRRNLFDHMTQSPKMRGYLNSGQERIRMQEAKIDAVYFNYKKLCKIHEVLWQIYDENFGKN